MGRFQLNKNQQGDVLKIQVVGVIDEDADFSPYSLVGSTIVELDAGGVTSINSCGIREWVKWMNTNKTAKIFFSNCPKVIVDQMNMVQGFLPDNARVRSFFVPFYNEDSDEEKTVLFSIGKEFSESGQLSVPAVRDSKGSEMEMDVIEAKYFKFLKKM